MTALRLAALRHPAVGLGLLLLAGVVVPTLFAPLLCSHPPAAWPTPLRAPPQVGYWFGTDAARRDLWTLTLYGGRTSLGVAGVAALLGTGVGAAVGIGAAWGGPWFDRAAMAATDLWLALPRLVVLLVVTHFLGPDGRPLQIAVLIGLTAWMGVARVVRSELLAVRELDHVVAARALGLRGATIARRHLLPAVVPTLLVWAPAIFGQALLAEAALAFLGPGAGATTPSWGALVAAGAGQVSSAWWAVAAPVGAITVAVVGAHLLADGIRDVVQPGASS